MESLARDRMGLVYWSADIGSPKLELRSVEMEEFVNRFNQNQVFRMVQGVFGRDGNVFIFS
jgi:hypothetical protein